METGICVPSSCIFQSFMFAVFLKISALAVKMSAFYFLFSFLLFFF